MVATHEESGIAPGQPVFGYRMSLISASAIEESNRRNLAAALQKIEQQQAIATLMHDLANRRQRQRRKPKPSRLAPAQEPELLTRRDVAELLNVSTATVSRMVRDKELPVVCLPGRTRTQRFRRVDLERALQSSTGSASPSSDLDAFINQQIGG
jgi:excisionase family DNA binding protein